MTALSLIAVVVAIVVALYFSRRKKLSRSDRYCRLFRLPPEKYQLLGTDLGGGNDKIVLRADGLIGAPDAVFKRLADGHIVVGEAKRRRHRGKTTLYEDYQVTLYMGMAKHRHRTNVSAIIRYGCGTCVQRPFNPQLYRDLLKRVPEYRRVEKRLCIDKQQRFLRPAA